jgi:hypothetical protein
MGIRIGGLTIKWSPIRRLLISALSRVGLNVWNAAKDEAKESIEEEFGNLAFPYEHKGERKIASIPPDLIEFIEDLKDNRTGRGFKRVQAEQAGKVLANLLIVVFDDAAEKNLELNLDKALDVVGVLPGMENMYLVQQLAIIRDTLARKHGDVGDSPLVTQ